MEDDFVLESLRAILTAANAELVNIRAEVDALVIDHKNANKKLEIALEALEEIMGQEWLNEKDNGPVQIANKAYTAINALKG